MSILLAIFVCVALAYFLGEIAKLVKLPRVIGQLIAGVILGIPVIRNTIFDAAALDALGSLANIGFILLLFFTGLEINLFRFKSNLERGCIISIFRIAVPLILGFVVSKMFGLGNLQSLIIGITLSVGAVAVSVDVLEELNILKTAFASKMMSAGAVHDVIELLIIAIVLAIAKISALKYGLYSLLFEVALFIALVIMLKSLIIPFILRFVEKEKSATSLFAGAVIIALLMAALSEFLGLGSLIGALIAGMIVRKTLLSGKDRRPWEEHEIAKMIHTIAFGLFAPLFFVFIGLRTDFYGNFNMLFSVIITGLALVGAVLGTWVGNITAPHKRENLAARYREGNLLGWGLAVKGDTDLIIAAIALQHNLISEMIFTSLVFMGIVTTIIAVIMFRMNIRRECKYFKMC